MECTLLTLIACFSWSGLYFDGGLEYLDIGSQYTYREVTTTRVVNFGSVRDLPPEESTKTIDDRHNPYGRLSIGYQIELRNVTWSLDVSHQSSIETGKDRGVNSVRINARWFPFR